MSPMTQVQGSGDSQGAQDPVPSGPLAQGSPTSSYAVVYRECASALLSAFPLTASKAGTYDYAPCCGLSWSLFGLAWRPPWPPRGLCNRTHSYT